MSALPWRNIKIEDGVAVVYASEQHLADFPRFMHYILLQKVGLEDGVFKIRVIGTSRSKTNVDRLCQFVKSYLSKITTDHFAHGDVDSVPVSQHFFYGSYSSHLYGLQQIHCTKAQIETYLKKASDPSTFSNGPAKCCTDALALSTDALEQHYWTVVRTVSSKSDALKGNVTKPYIQNLIEEGEKKRSLYYGCSSKTDAEKVVSSARNLGGRRSKTNEAIFYFPGIPLASESFPLTENFSLTSLKTILDLCPGHIPGIHYPLLYVGQKHSSFPWHIEDKALFSINALHVGAPCVWFFVPPAFFMKFSHVAKFFPLDPGQVSCFLSLLHKYFIGSRNLLMQFGIPVKTVIQREGDIVVAYPFASHAGFKMGWNLQEAANFADPWWVEPALFVPPCVCLPTSSNIDMKEILAAVRPDLLESYLRRHFISLAKAVCSNEFVKIVGLLPSITDVGPKAVEETSKEDMKKGTLSENEQVDECKVSFKGSRYALQCPQQDCPKMLEGGRGKKGRMVQHIIKKHAGCPKLLEKFEKNNPPREIKSQILECPICMEKKAGNQSHLNKHIRKMHAKSRS